VAASKNLFLPAVAIYVRMRLAVQVTRMGEIKNACNILDGKPEGKRPLEGPRLISEDNIKMDLPEIG
jgi:hypothetical protein